MESPRRTRPLPFAQKSIHIWKTSEKQTQTFCFLKWKLQIVYIVKVSDFWKRKEKISSFSSTSIMHDDPDYIDRWLNMRQNYQSLVQQSSKMSIFFYPNITMILPSFCSVVIDIKSGQNWDKISFVKKK